MSAEPLLPVFLAYQALKSVETERADALRGNLEQLLAEGEIGSPDDLFAKARYLQDTARLDPSLITQEAVDTLVAGIAWLHGECLTQLAPVSAPTLAVAA